MPLVVHDLPTPHSIEIGVDEAEFYLDHLSMKATAQVKSSCDGRIVMETRFVGFFKSCKRKYSWYLRRRDQSETPDG